MCLCEKTGFPFILLFSMHTLPRWLTHTVAIGHSRDAGEVTRFVPLGDCVAAASVCVREGGERCVRSPSERMGREEEKRKPLACRWRGARTRVPQYRDATLPW